MTAIIWSSFLAVTLGITTNEVSELSPWLAKKVLRFAVHLEEKREAESQLMQIELNRLLDEVPGKLTKLVWAIGRLYFSGKLAIRTTLRSKILRLQDLRLAFKLWTDVRAISSIQSILDLRRRSRLPYSLRLRVRGPALKWLARRLERRASEIRRLKGAK